MPRVLVPLAQGCEELEAVTVIDLLRRAGIEVVTAGLEPGAVTASRQVKLIPDTTLEQIMDDEFDMVVLPGGQPGTDHLENDARLKKILAKVYENDRYVAAICAAPKVLAKYGWLDDRKAVSFPGVLDAASVQGLSIMNEPIVIDKKIVTSKGPGTAMDFALTLIELLSGQATKKQVEEGLQRP